MEKSSIEGTDVWNLFIIRFGDENLLPHNNSCYFAFKKMLNRNELVSLRSHIKIHYKL